MSSSTVRKNERQAHEKPMPGVDAAWEQRTLCPSLNLVKDNRLTNSGVLSITPLKAYLLFYNILSCALWIQIFLLTIAYISTPHASPSTTQSFLSPITKFFNLNLNLGQPTPKWGSTVIDQLRGSYHFMGLGSWVKVTQTLAILDVVHAALGLVKSNVGTAASQVFSRLWAVWAVVEMVPEVSRIPPGSDEGGD
jgi:very-long-chain (3R)-3-hydroxyacyl-CoA dehydratase